MYEFQYPDTSSLARHSIYKNLDDAIKHAEGIIQERYPRSFEFGGLRAAYEIGLETRRCEDQSRQICRNDILVSFGFHPERKIAIFLFVAKKDTKDGINLEFRLDTLFYNEKLDKPRWCFNSTNPDLKVSDDGPIPVDLFLWSGVSHFPWQ